MYLSLVYPSNRKELVAKKSNQHSTFFIAYKGFFVFFFYFSNGIAMKKTNNNGKNFNFTGLKKNVKSFQFFRREIKKNVSFQL